VLASYRAEDLRTPGWDQAFASTIEQHESSALRPEDLEGLGKVGLLWVTPITPEKVRRALRERGATD
jgi:hypothetical protein